MFVDTESNKFAAPSSHAGLGAAPFAGLWAFRLDVPIVWSNLAVGVGVHGAVRAVGRLQRAVSGDGTYRETLSLCDLRFPEWEHVWGDKGPRFKHRLVFPDSLFDNGYLPESVPSRVEHVIHGPRAGHLKSETIALTGGVRTHDTISSPWCFGPSLEPWEASDDDFNGLPGVTGVFDQRAGFSPVSADMHGVTAVSQVGLGFRLRFEYEVQPTSMGSMEGVVLPVCSDPKGHGRSAGAVVWPDIRVLWAEVVTPKKGTIEPAKLHQINFLNRFLNPQPDPDQTATIKMLRVEEGASCQRIRESIA